METLEKTYFLDNFFSLVAVILFRITLHCTLYGKLKTFTSCDLNHSASVAKKNQTNKTKMTYQEIQHIG